MIQPSPSDLGWRPPRVRWSGVYRGPLSLLFALAVCISVWAPRWVIGLPVRTTLGICLLMLGLVANPRGLRATITRHRALFGVIIATAAIGALVSAGNQCPTANWLEQLQEVQVQAVLTLLLAGVLIPVIGRQRFGGILIFAIGVSAAFSLAQAAGIQAAWDVRARLGVLQADDPLTVRIYTAHQRALGISLTPINLATQLTLAFATFGLLWQERLARQGRPVRVVQVGLLAAALLAAALCLASGNRSPILGFLIFIPWYLATRAPRLFLLCLPFALLASPLVFERDAQPSAESVRALNMDDSSAAGRLPLAKLGVLEFLDRPTGYGLCFDSTLYWQKFWPSLAGYENADAVAKWPIHNYFLIMLNKYGMLIFLVLPFVAILIGRRASSFLLFIPYIVHISFHNDGPLLADYLFWFVIALAPGPSGLGKRPRQKSPEPVPGPVPGSTTASVAVRQGANTGI